MKKSVLLFVLLLTSVGMWAQEQTDAQAKDNDILIAEKDWTGTDRLPWFEFKETYEPNRNGYAEADPDGIAITVTEDRGMSWSPQATVIPEIMTLEEGGNYKVVITAKFPEADELGVVLGNWSSGLVNNIEVTESTDFQEVEVLFEDYSNYCDGDGHVRFWCGNFLGTTIVKKAQVYEIVDGETILIAEKDWTGVQEEDLPWIGFDDDGGTWKYNGSAEIDPDGIAITVTEKTGNLWEPQGDVLEGGFDLVAGHDYKVVVTAKLPCDGIMQIYCGEASNQYVKATGDFQEIVWEFPEYDYNSYDPYIELRLGDFLGTTIIKKVQVYDMNGGEPVVPDPIPYQLMDWTKVEEYPYEYDQNNGFTVSMSEEGLELYYPRNDYWTTAIPIFDKVTFVEGHDYKVVITAKVPSEGSTEIAVVRNNWRWASAGVTANDEFQEITFRIENYEKSTRKAQVRFEYYLQNPGTLIIQKVEVFDTYCDPVAYQSKDWANCTKDDIYLYQPGEGKEGSIEGTADGIAITNPEYSSDYWMPQTMVMKDVVLKRDHQYLVRVTAKIPYDNYLYLRIGDWNNSRTQSKYVSPSNDFQDIDYEFTWSSYNFNGDAFVLFQNGRLVGTSVVKNIQIFDMTMLTIYDVMAITGKVNVNGTQELDFPETTDPDFKPAIILNSDNENFGRLTLNGNLRAISDLTMRYDFVRSSNWGRWYEDMQAYDDNREYFTSFINNSVTSIDNANITVRLYPNRWEFICLPYDVNLKDVKSGNGTPFVIRRYDGQKRAEDLLNETWVDMTEDDVLKAGIGYIWQTDYNYNQKENGDYYNTFSLRPAKDADLDWVLQSNDVTIPLDVHEGEHDYNLGWNMVGNPYPTYYDSRAMSFNAPFIVWSHWYGNYEAFSPIDDAYVLNPGQAFFVQSTADQASITFPKEGRQNDLEVRNGNRARQASTERSVVNFFVSNGEFGDRTRVVINPKASLAYEADKDASKFMSGEAKAIQFYSIEQGVRYAINERPLARGEVQLGMNCVTRGTYTLTMRTSADCMVQLIDRLTGEEVMLTEEGYTFESETGTFDDRFVVRFMDGSATGIETVRESQDSDDTYYDMQGRRISRPEKGIYIQKGKKVVVK